MEMPDRSRSLAASLGFVLWACFCVIGTAVAEDVPVISPASTEYAVKLAEYEAAQARFQDEARAYWNLVGEKRRGRIVKRQAGTPLHADDYVLTQPPVYDGPPKPRNPAAPPGEEEHPSRPQIPVVADFVRHAQEQYGFSPDRPLRENDFKRAYVEAARRAGLTRDQIVRVYGFESGGDGKYDVQAGLEHPGPDSRAISTALGYNQLLTTNSVELLAESGARFLEILRGKVSALPADAAMRLTKKIAILERMRAFSLSVPDDWSAHERIAAEPQGLGIHALNLDVDVGPLLQTQKLLDSVMYAKAKKYSENLTAAELEMMNLTGDGNGLDMISLPKDLRDQIPTSNFFQRNGYERNPVASRNPTVAKLIAATDAVMDRESKLPGARTLSLLYQARDTRMHRGQSSRPPRSRRRGR
jgi:hypothetical protein